MKHQYLEALQDKIDIYTAELECVVKRKDFDKHSQLVNRLLGLYEAKEIIMKTYNKTDEYETNS